MAVDYELLTDEEMLHIWVEVKSGRGKHGDFLKSFADAFVRADVQNLSILESASKELIKKYKLLDYLDNFGKG